MKKSNSQKNNYGFSIIEVILAGALLAIIVFGIVSAWLYGEHALIKAGDNGRGIAIASEGIELTRNLRDIDFGALQDGTYALTNTGSAWTLTPNQRETIGAFFRTITIASDGTSRRNITSTVTWNNADGTPGSISSSTVLSNWQQVKSNPRKVDSALVITNIVASPASNSVTVTWNTNKAASSRIQYGTTSSYGSDSGVADTSPMVLSHSMQISSLTIATTYHFRIIAVDATGATAYSLDSTFVTAPDTTPPVITGIATNAYMTAFIVSWTTDEASSSRVSCGVNDVTEITTTTTNTNPRVISHQVTINGLTPITEYQCSVYSIDASGNQAISEIFTKFTMNHIPDITNIAFPDIGTTYFVVTWDTDILASSKVRSANLLFPDTPEYDTNPYVLSHSVVVSGLQPCTTYGPDDLTLNSWEPYGAVGGGQVTPGVTTAGCASSAQVMDEHVSEMTQIDAVSVRPYNQNDSYEYVYTISKSTETKEMSIFAVDVTTGNIENETHYGSKNLAILGVNDPLSAVFVIRNYLFLISNATQDQVFVFEIDQDNPLSISPYTTYSVGNSIGSAYVKRVSLNGVDSVLLFLGSDGKMYVVTMEYTMDGNDEIAIDSNANSWHTSVINGLVGGLITDLYVPDEEVGTHVQRVFATSPDDISLVNITSGLPEDFNKSAPTNRDMVQDSQVVGNGLSGGLIVSGVGNNLNNIVNPGAITNIYGEENVGSNTKSLSKTFPNNGYVFANRDVVGEELTAISVNVSNNSELVTEWDFDLSSYFDSSYYDGVFAFNVSTSIAYLPLSGDIFFSKWHKVIIVDPGI